MDPRIVQLGITLLPELLDWIKLEYQERHPHGDVLTDEDVKLALSAAVALSLARGDTWLTDHPPEHDAA